MELEQASGVGKTGTGIIPHCAGKAVSNQSEERRRGLRWTRPLLVLTMIFGISASGCVSEPKRTYSDEFVKTFVDLTMLYERNKMEQKLPDSTYKVSVQEFFTSRGLDQEGFKKQVEVLSNDAEVWKLFIGDVTKRIDSLKQAEYNSNGE